MYSKFYGLTHKPFELTPNPDVIYLSDTHQEALSILLYGVYNRKGFLQISGNVGTGKSTIVQALIGKLEDNVHLCHIPNPNFTVEEFYYYISAKFGVHEFDGNKAKFILNLADYLKQCQEKEEYALLIIDEAQVLSLELLEEIRLLSNQEYTEFGVLSIFFVGQQELNTLLNHKKMEPLRNRIGIRFNLEPLTFEETVAYVQYRLRKAGRTVLLFSQKALEKIHEASGGIPRTINILCDNALLVGFAEQRAVIDESIINDCILELEQTDKDADSESDTLGFEIESEPEAAPQMPAQIEVVPEIKTAESSTFTKRLVFVLVIICALFFAMMYTTEYWGRLPGTSSAKAWFEKHQFVESIYKRIKHYIITRKSDAKFNSSEEKTVSPKAITSTAQHIDKNISTGKTIAAEKSNPELLTQEPISNSENDATRETYSKDEAAIEYIAIMKQDGVNEPHKASLIKDETAGEQIAILRDSDGINYISIKRQLRAEPENLTGTEDSSIPKTVETGLKIDNGDYVSISSNIGGANIRVGPSITDNVLRSVSPGYPLRVIRQQGEWSLVEDFKKRRGWIASKLIIENNTVILMYDQGNLRSGMGYDADIVAEIDYGMIMQVAEKQGSWLKVNKTDGVIGWIHAKMVWP